MKKFNISISAYLKDFSYLIPVSRVINNLLPSIMINQLAFFQQFSQIWFSLDIFLPYVVFKFSLPSLLYYEINTV